MAYVDIKFLKKSNLSLEVEGRKYPLKLEKKALHDPDSKLLRA